MASPFAESRRIGRFNSMTLTAFKTTQDWPRRFGTRSVTSKCLTCSTPGPQQCCASHLLSENVNLRFYIKVWKRAMHFEVNRDTVHIQIYTCIQWSTKNTHVSWDFESMSLLPVKNSSLAESQTKFLHRVTPPETNMEHHGTPKWW